MYIYIYICIKIYTFIFDNFISCIIKFSSLRAFTAVRITSFPHASWMAPPAVLTTNGITSHVVYCGLHHQLSAHVTDGTNSCIDDNSIAVRGVLAVWFKIFTLDVFVLVVLDILFQYVLANSVSMFTSIAWHGRSLAICTQQSARRGAATTGLLE